MIRAIRRATPWVQPRGLTVFRSWRLKATDAKPSVTRITNVKVVRGGAVLDSDLWFSDGRILGASNYSWASGRVEMQADIVVDGCGSLVVPGFIDLQCNGAFGVDFSSPSLTEDDVAKVTQGVLAHGVTSFLPTVVTSSHELYRTVLPKLVPRSGSAHGAEVLGVHCAGPFIRKEKSGTQVEDLVKEEFADGFKAVSAMYGEEHIANGTVRLVTLAPELEGSREAIAGLVGAGVKVSAGYTNIGIKEAEVAVLNGVHMITHLFNAMAQFHHRDPGIAGLIGMDDPTLKVHYGLIADGLHVHPTMVNTAFRTHGEGCVLVTDSVSALGVGCGTHKLGGVEVVVDEVAVWGGPHLHPILGNAKGVVLRARKAGTETLVGSVMSMHGCFTNLMAFTGCNVAMAAECASTHAAAALGLVQKGRLEPGCDADFLFLDPKTYALRETWCNGQRAWEASPHVEPKVQKRLEVKAHPLDGHHFIGIDLGGTTISVGVVNHRGQISGDIASSKLGEDRSPATIASQIGMNARTAVHAAGLTLAQVSGVGICSPGLVDVKSGTIVSAANLPGWRDIPLTSLLAKELGVEHSMVTLEQDANAALLAEVWAGAACGKRDVVMLTLGTGIGGAILSNGSVIRGKGGAAGELGHMILVPDGREHGGAGVKGIFEGYASATAVAARVKEDQIPSDSSLKDLSTVTSLDVFQAAGKGDRYANQVVHDTARFLALGCINVVRSFDPEMILFAGGMALAGEQLLAETRRQYARYHWNVAPVNTELRVAELGNTAGVVGAAYASYTVVLEGQAVLPTPAPGHFISQHSAGHFVNPIAHLEGGPLPIFVFEEPIDVSRTVAEEIAALITSKKAAGETCVLGLATGSTPIRVYKELIRMHREEGLSFEGVVTFNLDEYYPMLPDSPQSYRQFMREKLFDHIDIEPSNTHVPDGTVAEGDLDAHCITYEQSIRDAGGIDLQILGLGRNGHIGFNEPGSARDSRTRKIHLESRTRKDAAKDFGGEEHVPTLAVSMGVGSILDARRVILMAFGEGKADIAAQAFQGNITEDVTASFLQEHGDAEVYLDREAAACLVTAK